MQYSLLALSFSLGVMAMPGQVLPRTKTPPSKTTAAAATTTTSDPIADRSSRRAEASLLCNPNGMDSESWVSNDMDYWISFFSNEYPKNVVNDEPIDDKKDTFVNFLAKMTGTLGDYVCNAVTCDVDISSKSDCNTGKFNPYLYFGIFSLKNFFEFTSKAHEALHDQFGAFTAKADKMVLEFTDHKMATSGVDAAAANTALTLLTGVLAFFAPVMAAGEAAAAATVVGASVGLAVSFNGILGSAQDAAAQIIQEEIQHIVSLEDTLYNITNITDKAIMSLAKGVLETIPDNSQDNIGNGWAEWPNGAPLILANGTFANPMNSTSFELTSDSFFNTIAGGAINQCWQMDSVFLAKAASKTGPGGFNPKTMDLNSLDKYNRVCDAHICYFFVKAQPVSNMGNWNEWKNAQGMDKLGNYKIEALEFAKAADHWQSKYGSYIKVPDNPSDFLEDFRDPNGPPGGLFINLPVVTYDDCPNITSMDAYKHTDEAWFLTRLGKCLNHLHGWPSSYPKMSVGKFS